MAEAPYYTLKPAEPRGLGGISTAALRKCAICDHVVDTMGGPGVGSICPECATLIKRGQIKMDREAVEKAVSE